MGGDGQTWGRPRGLHALQLVRLFQKWDLFKQKSMEHPWESR